MQIICLRLTAYRLQLFSAILLAMEIKPPQFYEDRRKELRQKKKSKTIKKTVIFTISMVLIMAFYLATVNSITEIIVNKISVTKPAIKEKTVLIAKCGKMEISLPFSKVDFNASGFHTSDNPLAYSLTPIGKKVNTKKMPKNRAQKILKDTENLSFLKLQRSGGNGKSTSAVDIGAKAGSLVISPISGTVILVRKYRLYGYINDFEIHILPLGYKDRHMVIIHLTSPLVKKGDVLKRDTTPIAKVRDISKFLKPQLRDYTKEKGNHIHLQVNKLRKDGSCTIKPGTGY